MSAAGQPELLVCEDRPVTTVPQLWPTKVAGTAERGDRGLELAIERVLTFRTIVLASIVTWLLK
jgi:hypothetical protein